MGRNFSLQRTDPREKGEQSEIGPRLELEC